MTEPRVEEVREVIAEFICNQVADTYSDIDFTWEQLSKLEQGDFIEYANQILSLKDKNGKPMLGIINPDWSLPDQWGKVAYERLKALLEDHNIKEHWLDSVVGETQTDMLASNFRRVIIVEE